MTELPLLVIDVQRGGPSTGLPTKTEQADLLQAMFGRNGEAPVPIVAPQSPGDCFDAALEAARIAVTYRTPVMLLSDGYLANGSEPWRIPDVDDLPAIDPAFATEPNHERRPTASARSSGPTCATRRPWPGRGRSPAPPASSTASAASRRATGHGNISYDPANHDLMVRTRQAKVDRIADVAAAAGGRRPLGRGQGAGDRLGLDVRPDRRRRPPGPQGRLPRRAGAPAPPQPVPEGPRRDPQALRQGARARDEPRPALAAAARQVPRRRHRLQPGPRPAAQGRRARRGHRRPGRRGRGHRGRPHHGPTTAQEALQ